MLLICCQLTLASSFSVVTSSTRIGSRNNVPTPATNAELPVRSELRTSASRGAGNSDVLPDEDCDPLQTIRCKKSDHKFNLPALVVNLDDRVDRWQTIRRQLKSFGIDTVRISAIPASSLRKPAANEHLDEEVVRWKYSTTWSAQFDSRIEPNQVLTLSDSEYSTCLSHIKAWKYIVDEKLPAALILEDDAVLGSDFKSVLSPALKEVPTNWDILYAGYLSKEHADRAKVSTHIYSMIDGVFGMHGYLLTRAGAQKLLALLPVVQPLDNFVAKLALDKQIEAYLVEPKVVWQDLFGGSDVYHSGPISGGVVYENKVIDSLRKSFGNGISIVRAWIVEHSRITFLLLSVVLLIAGHTCSSRASCFPWSQRGELTCFRSKKGFSLV